MEKQNNHIDRRGFLKIVGISAATTTAALYGCGSGTKSSQGRNASSPVPTDQMTYRSVGGIKDKVSLLGYGCMRWPTVPSPEGKGDLINQEAVNELVDYAIAKTHLRCIINHSRICKWSILITTCCTPLAEAG